MRYIMYMMKILVFKLTATTSGVLLSIRNFVNKKIQFRDSRGGYNRHHRSSNGV